MPFVRAGIPAVELISLEYGPVNIFWHTPFDTVGKCSAVSLGIVGRVLLGALDDLESGRTPKPLLAFLESGAAGMPASRSPLPSRSSVRPVVLPHRSTRRYSYARPDSCSRGRLFRLTAPSRSLGQARERARFFEGDDFGGHGFATPGVSTLSRSTIRRS